MNYLSIILGLAGVCIGAALAFRRSTEPRQRWAGGILAVVAILAVVLSRSCSTDSLTRRFEAANHWQGNALGFGLGQHLKQTQPGRKLVILRTKPSVPSESDVLKGLTEGLEGGLPIVGERTLDISSAVELGDVGGLFTPELLSELKATGADIVLSFAGLPYRIRRDGGYTAIDTEATLQLWRTPECRGLQWVLPQAQELWPPGAFSQGRVLAVAQEKPQQFSGKGFPAYLDIKGTPAELFSAWFELVTKDDQQ
jgi:hypothetical protein